ncbi:BTAD domain-containing putative transcriptional regulator [Crossiella sp. NPDC003009]
MTLEFRLLGPTETVHNGALLPALPGKHRTVLAALLLRPGRPVSITELTEQVWEQPPRNPKNALQTYIRRMRATLPEPVLRTTATGYLADVPPDSVDLHRFRALVAEAGGDPHAERATLRAALALWRGPALSDVFSPALRVTAAGLEAERQRALERRIDLDLALGGHAELVPELQQLTTQDPLRERHWAQLMLALAGSGRQAEALQAFQTASETLSSLLGIRPSPELRAQHQAILTEQLPRTTPPPAPRGGLPIHQLPLDINDFVGRAELVEAITTAPHGCTVIYGQPGVGKTALAVHIGHLLKDRYPDGQLYVDLRGYSPEEKPTTFAVLARFLRAFGLTESEIPADEPGRARLYQSLLADRRFLVLLDNAADATTVAPLVPTGKHCRTLITSRGVIPGLPECRRITLDVLSHTEARSLLRRVLGPALVEANPAEADRLAELCARLPLALRVAAANIAGLSSPDLGTYLHRLAGRDRLAELAIDDDRDTVVRRAFDLSYRALSAPARRMFRLSSVTPGSDLTEPTATALAGEPAGAALAELADAHLLDEYRPGRYRAHDLLHLYAAERHQAEDAPADRAAAEDRLLEHCLTGTVQLTGLLYGPRTETALDDWSPQRAWPRPRTAAEGLEWFDTEFATLTGVQGRAASADPERSAMLGIALLRVFYIQYQHAEQVILARRTVEAADRAGAHRPGADARVILSEILLWLRDYRASVRLGTEAKLVFTRLGLPAGEALALIRIGHAHGLAGRLDRSQVYFERAHQLATAAGSRLVQGVALTHLGAATMRLGRLAESGAQVSAAIEIFAELGAAGLETLALADLANQQVRLGRPELALRSLSRSRDLRWKLGIAAPEAVGTGLIAEAYAELGEYEQAQRQINALRTDPSPVRRRLNSAYGLVAEGIAEHRRGRPRLAADRFAAAYEQAAPLGQFQEMTQALLGNALAHLDLAELPEARRLARAAVALARRTRQRTFEARGLLALARTEQRLGATAAAAQHARAALTAFQETGYEGGTGQTLALLAELGAAQPSR